MFSVRRNSSFYGIAGAIKKFFRTVTTVHIHFQSMSKAIIMSKAILITDDVYIGSLFQQVKNKVNCVLGDSKFKTSKRRKILTEFVNFGVRSYLVAKTFIKIVTFHIKFNFPLYLVLVALATFVCNMLYAVSRNAYTGLP